MYRNVFKAFPSLCWPLIMHIWAIFTQKNGHNSVEYDFTGKNIKILPSLWRLPIRRFSYNIRKISDPVGGQDAPIICQYNDSLKNDLYLRPNCAWLWSEYHDGTHVATTTPLGYYTVIKLAQLAVVSCCETWSSPSSTRIFASRSWSDRQLIATIARWLPTDCRLFRDHHVCGPLTATLCLGHKWPTMLLQLLCDGFSLNIFRWSCNSTGPARRQLR